MYQKSERCTPIRFAAGSRAVWGCFDSQLALCVSCFAEDEAFALHGEGALVVVGFADYFVFGVRVSL